MKRIGLLTSGGDCQGLNTALRGVAKALYEVYAQDVTLLGFQDGFRGLIENDAKTMQPSDFSGILTLGGTILGTSRQPFKKMRDPVDPAYPDGPDKLAAMLKTVEEQELDALVVLGGNGTHKTADLLSQNGVPVVSLPKTIDNDLWGTDITFGFQSAVNIATDVIDSIHTTATSHGRIFIIELMGNKAGWLTLHAGMAGGADIILLPEIPYDEDVIVAALQRRKAQRKKFSIIVIAEGAMSSAEAKMSKKERKKLRQDWQHPSVAYELAQRLEELKEQEIRVTVPGHFQRGGTPCPFDRVLATQLGTAAAQLIARGQFGFMVGMQNQKTVPVPLAEVAGRRDDVPADHPLIESGRAIGVSFGEKGADAL